VENVGATSIRSLNKTKCILKTVHWRKVRSTRQYSWFFRPGAYQMDTKIEYQQLRMSTAGTAIAVESKVAGTHRDTLRS
jgi:hypothetical protein